ncbi:plasmid replication protein, CyRepA1 family [Paraburkholderia sp. Cpub6]|uniref:plasmid replication protein, CyRepA1 family n=1 Tax=Paraburkholderia sp. Cpub6 TaxID=2723094 RepID=UPI00160963DC|nr:plasmid replication protein, CyRepA1 family [Paraburkholderia sp. Cpub6]MBB5456771.1 phage/plasmid primase-like uncharacterized protein [Paraburkholderia sp. Cpub6]
MTAMLTEAGVVDQFRDEMAKQGIHVDRSRIVADGERHRVHADGDRPGSKNVFYTLYDDARGQNGVFGHNGRYGPDVRFYWHSSETRTPLSDEEERAIAKKIAADKAREVTEKAIQNSKAAAHAVATLKAAQRYSAEDVVPNKHLSKRGMKNGHGAFYGEFRQFTGGPIVSEHAILVPIRDIDGNVRSLQAIFPDAKNALGRDRTYLFQGDKTGKFHVIGQPVGVDGMPLALKAEPLFLVAEGFATGVAVHEATGYTVIVAFDAGSLLPVAEAIRDAYNSSMIVFAADNDQWTSGNPGLTKARVAAEAVDGFVAFPNFDQSLGKLNADGKLEGPTDFDDLARTGGDGKAAVRASIEAALIQAANQTAAAAIETAGVLDFAKKPAAFGGADAVALPKFAKADDLPSTDVKSISLEKHIYALASFAKLPEAGKDGKGLRAITLERELRNARGYAPTEPGAEGMHHSAASYAWAVCKKRVRFTPAEMDVDDLIGRIRCSGAPIHEKTLVHMGGWMNWLCSQRRSTALLRVGISGCAKARHIYTSCSELPVLRDDDYRGVILIRAPMGSGKTKRIGLAFSRFAQYSNAVSGDARFVAIVHRVTLVSALVQVLGLAHYRDGKCPITKENAVDVTALGVCLPSINKASLRAIMQECRYLLIDEIAQVLTFLESKECFEDEGESSRQAVYKALQDLVRNATCVIGMDAGINDRVIEFIEQCRPAGEQIRIYDMAQNNEGLIAKFGFGEKAVQMFYEEANRRLDAGETLWIGCDSRKQATELHEVLSRLHGNKRLLLITSDTTDRTEQRAFLENADRVSREYDCVIHSPSISSGLSIEHKRKNSAGEIARDENRNDIVDQHFKHCMFLGGGCSISAADALQMMRRVRYVKTWTVAIHQNNTEPGPTDPREIIAAWEKASAAEGRPTQATPIGWYFAGVEADRNGARIEFANELLWLMEQALFQIVRSHQTEDRFDPSVRKKARLEIEMREKSLIVAARDLSEGEAALLQRSANKSDADRAALKRHEIAGLFGSDVFNIAPEKILDAPLWNAYQNGRGLRRIDNFSGAVHGVADTSEGSKALEDMKFDVATRQFQALLWGDTVISPGVPIEMAAATAIVERAMSNRITFAYHGIIPKRFGVGKGKPKGDRLEDVADMLELMGLKSFKVASAEDPAGYALAIEQASFAFMEEWSARRRAMQIGTRYVAPAAPAQLPTLAERIQLQQMLGLSDVMPCVVVFSALFDRINAMLPKDEQITRKALAESLDGLGMKLFSSTFKLKRGGKWVKSTVYIDPDLVGTGNDIIREALDASAGLGPD